MRRSALLLVVPLGLVACSSSLQTTSGEQDGGSTVVAAPSEETDPPRKKPDPRIGDDESDDGEDEIDAGPIDSSDFPEEVYVFMRSYGGLWMCTGTLVSSTTVVTAAHCLNPEQFDSYYIVAPHAPGRVQREAHNPKSFGGSFEAVENPDIGILTLKKPLVLPRYAELTDVVDAVEAATPLPLADDAGAPADGGLDAGADAGAPVFGAAYVRMSQQEAESPLAWTGDMSVTSALQFGYVHGFATPMYSKGGDSGAGLFLVENGVKTHKLIGVERQPEPSRNIDHFTRIDAEFLAWFKTATSAP